MDAFIRMMPLVGALAGVLLGFLLAQGVEWLRRCRRRRAHWSALRAEIDFCRGRAEAYREAGVAAPLYRLPAITYSHSLPALLGDGAVSEPEVRALVEFFSEVETLNRGLDLVQAARERDDQQTIQAEYGRNLLKIQRLIELHGAARAATDAHLRSWTRAGRRGTDGRAAPLKMDKTSLNIVSIVLGGVGLFVVLTKYSVPELHATFLESNPFVVKRDVIESVMTCLFTSLTLLGLAVQVGVAVWGDRIEERVHPTRFYGALFVVALAVGVALVPLVTAAGNRLARRSWLPQVIENQKGPYKAAKFVIEHDGWREDQLAVKGTLPEHERFRSANLETATRQVEQIEKVLEAPPRSTDLSLLHS